MGRKMTSISLPGVFGSGLADWGVKTVPEMVTQIRQYAANQKAAADAILAAADSDFRVDTYEGVHVQRNRRILQAGQIVKADFSQAVRDAAIRVADIFDSGCDRCNGTDLTLLEEAGLMDQGVCDDTFGQDSLQVGDTMWEFNKAGNALVAEIRKTRI